MSQILVLPQDRSISSNNQSIFNCSFSEDIQNPLSQRSVAQDLSKISKPVYLYFLNRELLSAAHYRQYGNYSDNRISQFLQDIRLIFFCCYEYCYLSPSLVFEENLSHQVLKQFPLLFRSGNIRLTTSVIYGLENFIDYKQEQYSHAKERYPFYFNDTWKKIEDIGLTYLNKSSDTSKIIANQLIENFDNFNLTNLWALFNFQEETSTIRKITPYLIDDITNRGKRAVTALLFKDTFEKHQPSNQLHNFCQLKIVEQYIQDYLLEFDGTIPTGLLSGVNIFSYLAPTFPFHHISLWNDIYCRLGCSQAIRKFSEQDILNIREDPTFQAFIDTIRDFIIRFVQENNLTNPHQNPQIEKLNGHIRVSLNNFTVKKPDNIEQFLYTLEVAKQRFKQ